MTRAICRRISRPLLLASASFSLTSPTGLRCCCCCCAAAADGAVATTAGAGAVATGCCCSAAEVVLCAAPIVFSLCRCFRLFFSLLCFALVHARELKPTELLSTGEGASLCEKRVSVEKSKRRREREKRARRKATEAKATKKKAAVVKLTRRRPLPSATSTSRPFLLLLLLHHFFHIPPTIFPFFPPFPLPHWPCPDWMEDTPVRDERLSFFNISFLARNLKSSFLKNKKTQNL